VAEGRAVALATLDALAAADRLVTDTNPVSPSDPAQSSYRQLLGALDRCDSGEKLALEEALHDALRGTQPSLVNHHLLGSALIRSIAGNPAYWRLESNVAPRPELISRLDRALDSLGREASPYAPIGEGIHAFVRADDESAYERLASAPTHPLFAQIVRDDFIGARTCRPLPTLRDIGQLSLPIPIGEIDWLLRSPLGTDPFVITFFCDDSYFRAFSGGIVESLPRDALGLTVHFHIVNPQRGTRTLVDELSRSAERKRLSLHVSSEITLVTDRAYFASVRFMRMREFLQIFDRALLYLDTDSEFETDPRGWLNDFRPDAVNILFCKGPWSGGFVPWRAFWAGIVYVPQNGLGREFAEVLHHVLAYLWTPEPNYNWFVDQNALYTAYLLVREERGEDGFKNLPSGFHRRLRHSLDFKERGLRHNGLSA
jgi:hypothetical protein